MRSIYQIILKYAKTYTKLLFFGIIEWNIMGVFVLAETNINEPWVSTKEISEHLGVTIETVRKWIKVKAIPCSRMGKLWKFKKSEVDEWVKSGGAAEERND